MSLVKPSEMTEATLAARRVNAPQSHGPVPPQGKANCAESNLRHGFYSEQQEYVLRKLGEDPAEFDALMASVHEDLDPQGGLERELVSRIGRTLWRLRRADRMRDGQALKRIEVRTELEKGLVSPRLSKMRELIEPFDILRDGLDCPGGPTPEAVANFVDACKDHPLPRMPELLKLLEPLKVPEEKKARRKAVRQAREVLQAVMDPLLTEVWKIGGQFERITSPENLAAMTAPQDNGSMLMQRMEDSSLRQLWRLTRVLTNLRQSAPTRRDVKNTDRSEEVYENKGHADIMPEKKSDFVSENTEISQNLASFS